MLLSRSRFHRFSLFVAWALALVLPKAVSAQETSLEGEARSERFRLAYEAPAECPTFGAFSTLVRERIAGDWEASPRELARRIDVIVSQRGDRYVARIEFSTARGERVTRAVSGAVCADVVNAIALVTALAIRARGSETFEQGTPGTVSGSEPLAAPPVSADSTTAVPDRAAVRKGAAPAPAQGARSPLHLRIGARAAIASGVGPEATFGAGLFAALEWPALRLGLSLERFESGAVYATDIPAAFRLLVARLEGCPAFPIGTRSVLEPCAFAEVGSFHGEAQVDPPRVLISKPASVVWLAPGLLGRWLLRFEPIVVQLEVLGRFPLRQEKFYVQTEQQVIFRVPAFSAGAALGLGLRF